MPIRIDRAKLQEPRIDQNGYLLADAHVTRAGVFTYRHPDGKITKELRHPDDVFKADSLASLRMRPVVDEHPATGKLDSENTRHLAVGWSGENVERDDNYVKAPLQVTDKGAIDKIMNSRNPKREISCGYRADVIPEEGTYNGERYDHRQTNIEYNHVALVWKGRAGRDVRMHLDSEDAVIDSLPEEVSPEKPETSKPSIKKDAPMTIKIKRDAIQTGSFKLDAMEISVDEGGELAVNQVLTKLDDAVGHIREVERKNDELQGKIDGLEKQAQETADPAKLDALAKERADVCGVATHLKVDGFDGKPTAEIKRMIVQKSFPDTKLDTASDGYVDGLFDAVVSKIKEDNKGLESLAALKEASTPPGKTKADREDEEKKSPREDYLHGIQGMHSKTEEQLRADGFH